MPALSTVIPRLNRGIYTNKKGFTLVELLVVITIIAILSVIGITVFSGVQKNARDARRRGDIDALAQTAEVNYRADLGAYTLPGGSGFVSGSVPQDPLNGQDSCQGTKSNQFKKCYYCMAGAGMINLEGCRDTLFEEDLFTVHHWFGSDGIPTTWAICANLETGTKFCRRNQQ